MSKSKQRPEENGAGVLSGLWASLGTPSRRDDWHATRIGGRARVAKSFYGDAAVLVRYDTRSHESSFALKTQHVTYRERVPLGIADLDQEVEVGEFAMLVCGPQDYELQQHFLRIVQLIFTEETLSSAPQFAIESQRVFDLFRALAGTARNSAQGLWAELFVISVSADPAVLVEAWHSDPNELHDFVVGERAIEVKSSATGLREHHFSLDQLNFRSDSTFVASVLLELDDRGPTIYELLERVTSVLPSAGLRQRAQRIAISSLGRSWREHGDVRYSWSTAVDSLVFFDASEVPRVSGPIPAAVRNVRFVSSLADARPLPSRDACAFLR